MYAAGNNSGIKIARGAYVIILNNDTEVDKNWLKETLPVIEDTKVGAAQPKILILNKAPATIDYAGVGLDRYGYAKGYGMGEVDRGQFDNNQDTFYAGGTAMILKREVLDKVGLFEEKFSAHWEDTDLSWRIRLNGYRIMLIPKAIVYHKGSESMKRFARKKDIAFNVRKNRIMGLLKNYSLFNLARVLPVLFSIYSIVFIKELFWNRNASMALSSILAILWNIRELPYTIKQRKFIQSKIRVVRDSEIIRFMEKRPVFIPTL
jgi:GT2 family glycosyltransferase